MSDLATAAVSSAWTARPAWDGIAAPGHVGAEGAGVTITLRDGLGLASIIAADGQEGALAVAVKARFGLALPETPGVARAGGHALVWSGPGQWLLVAQSAAGFADDIAALSQHAAVADQSQSRAALRIGGPKARATLAKGCMLDLHDSAFPPGFAALTSIAYIGVQLWRVEDAPDGEGAVFEMMVPRSMAGSFWSWLSASAAEFGCTVAGIGRG